MAKRELKKGKLPGMTDEEFSSVVFALRDDARDWIDSDVKPVRERAWRYYNGEVDKKVSTGRSKAVLTEVRDAVESVIVSLLRIFLSTKTPAEFMPTGVEDIELAKQQTEAANHVFYTQNKGFRVLSDAFRDALVAKTGALRVWWDDSVSIEETVYEGITETEFSELVGDPDVELIEFSKDEDDFVGDQGTPESTFSVKIQRIHDKGQVRVAAIPPEEVIFSKSATSVEDATLVGVDGNRKAQDVVSEGLATWAQIEDHFSSMEVQHGDEATARSGLTQTDPQTEEQDITNREIRVSELYIRMDKDGDEIPELRRVIIIGDSAAKGSVVSDEIWDSVPIFVGSPFPLPHNIIGMGIADLTTDLQDVSTSVQRAMLDSLYAAVNPRYTAVQNQVNIPDLARNRFNDVIKIRQAGAVQPLTIPFVGRDALPVLQYFDERKDARTGVSKASMGLDADALQSSTAIGVNATITASAAKVESMARSLAEQLVVPAFAEINRLLTHYQDRDLMIRLRGKFVPMSTDGFVTTMDVTTNVGIGRGSDEEKLAVLGQIMAKQETILTTIGSENPLVTMDQYAQTLNDMVSLSPVKDASKYFNSPEKVKELQAQAAERAKNQPPPEDPKAKAEMAKVQARIQLDQNKSASDQKIKRDEAEARIQLDTYVASENLKLKRQELLAEIQLEKMKVEELPHGPQTGNVRSPE